MHTSHQSLEQHGVEVIGTLLLAMVDGNEVFVLVDTQSLKTDNEETSKQRNIKSEIEKQRRDNQRLCDKGQQQTLHIIKCKLRERVHIMLSKWCKRMRLRSNQSLIRQLESTTMSTVLGTDCITL